MKTLLLLSIGCALATSAVAQTEKGARFIGANLGNLTYKTGKQQPTQYSISVYPTAGVFVADNVLLGGSIGITHERYKLRDVSGFTGLSVWQYGISPLARLYLPGAETHRFFGQLQGGISRTTIRQVVDRYGAPVRSSDTYGMAVAALGYNYFLAPGAALEITAGYTRNFTDSYDLNQGAFDIRAGFSVFLAAKSPATPAE